MKKIVLVALLLMAPAAHAGVYGDAFGKCLVGASTDTDKQQLVEWIFAAISLNPAIGPYTNISGEEREAIDRNMAVVVERLVGDACRKEAADALKYEGANAFALAFELLGRVAGMQIFASPEVSAGAQGFNQYIDMEKLQQKLEMAPGAP